MTNPKFESPDITARNIEKIAALFPNCVTEASDGRGGLKYAVNFDMLKQMLSPDVVEGDERYEFTWVGKKASVVEANKPIRKTLRPCPEESRDWDTTENLYIEGDNLEVLKLLQESYLGKVKMIYIDPPYNTGNDFIYQDDFMRTQEEEDRQSGKIDDDNIKMFTDDVLPSLEIDENEEAVPIYRNTGNNARFHSDWCSMMYSRLMLARNFLSDDGVIFISIDDNEVANLRKICDEIFGDSNFLAQMTVIVKTEGRRYGGFAKTHEQILIYSKDCNQVILNEIEVEGKAHKFIDEFGGFNIQDLRNQNARAFNSTNRPNLRYPFYVDLNLSDVNGFHKVYLEKKEGLEEVYPITINGYESVWRWGRNEKAKRQINDLVARKGTDNVVRIYQKMRKLSETPKTVLIDKEYLSNKGTKELQDLLGLGVFDFPKPLNLIKTLGIVGSDDNSIILDFFSGSATTAHAVMQLNAEDGGSRKFIMVQLPEPCDEKSEAYKAGYKNICEIGKERIRRAGDKIKAESPLTTENLDIGFRVLKLDDTNMKDVYYSPEEYSQDIVAALESNIKEDRTDLDLLFGCLIDWALPLSRPYSSETISGCAVHTYNDGDLIACFAENVPEDVVKTIARRKPLRAVFRDSSFANSPEKINVFEIFKMLAPDTKVKVI